MRPPSRSWFPLGGLVLALLFAGCTTDGDEGERALLQASHRIGEDLYSWADPQFTKPQGVGLYRRITAQFDVPMEMDRVGVAFRGNLVWPDNSSALLDIARMTGDGKPGQKVLQLNASQGREDDLGAIDTFWQFRPILQLQPGQYQIVTTGRGYIGHLEFQVHGIPRFTTSVNETFEVEDDEDPIEVEVFLNGWGRVPTVTLTAPGGSTQQVALVAPDEQKTHRFDPSPGTYRLDADTTGWGGRFVVRISQ